jgi:hypothetical protein
MDDKGLQWEKLHFLLEILRKKYIPANEGHAGIYFSKQIIAINYHALMLHVTSDRFYYVYSAFGLM